MSSDSARENPVDDESGDNDRGAVDASGAATGAEAADRDERPDDGETAAEGDAAPDVDADGVHDADGAPDEAGAGDEAGDEAGAAEAVGNRRSRRPRRVLLGSAALALAAFIVAAVFGVLWFVTATGDQADLARARDAVVDDAGKAVQAVTELDYKNPDRYFKRSKAVSTDDFGKQLTKAEGSLRKALSQTKIKVDTRVNDVAVQKLNDHEGSATFLAVVSTETTRGDKTGTKVMRLKGQMERVPGTDGQWKLAGLSQVPVAGSGAQAQKPGQQGQGSAQGAQQGSGQGSGAGK